MQVARQNVERAISTGQDVIGRTVKTNEAIGEIAKGQFERTTAQAKQAAGNATEQAEAQFAKGAPKASK